MSYVCAFRGRRDNYQVPLALAENGLLDQFITDAFAPPWFKSLAKMGPTSIRTKLEFRSEPGIPIERVHCLWATTLLERTRHTLGYAPMLTYNKLDKHFSEAAARRAAQTRSDLFLYSPYAWEAFAANYPHAPRKVLFQYHPHPDLEGRLLSGDCALYPGVGESFSGTILGQVPQSLLQRERDVWKHADLIFCASSFTKRSLLEAGCDAQRCHIVPYGIDIPTAARDESPNDAFHAVFVGSGGRRKGLHHLLHAWRHAVLPDSSKLTLVCRVIDREIERLALTTPRVEILRGLTQSQLNEVYSASSIFVMPSLVEGFGQVYLEALAQGCPVLGTANTCLPDLGHEADGIFLVALGDIEDLVDKLERLSRMLPGNRNLRHAARTCASRFTWAAFREGIWRTLKN